METELSIVQRTRAAVRDFVHGQLAGGAFTPMTDSWMQGFSPEFSRALGARGWLGMTWPRRWGGKDASALERFAVAEELLAHGAPVAAHWMAERQTGPLLLRFGSDRQKELLLPGIARGEIYVSIGLSEPSSGSDLASVSTRGVRTKAGWRLSGQKVWTSHAHRTHYLVALVRTDPEAGRHEALSQFIVRLDAPGVVVRPIPTMNGDAEFCEVFLDDVEVGDDALVGRPGAGWEQVTAELGHERGGPERYMSVFPLLAACLDAATADDEMSGVLGRHLGGLWALRALSHSMASRQGAEDLSLDVAISKDRGTVFEQAVVDDLYELISDREDLASLSSHSRHAVLSSPSFTLRGGTNQILRSLIARWLTAGTMSEVR
jgi:acyl-CoA dehydrogenase